METLTKRSAEAVAAAVPAGTLSHPLANWPGRELAAGLHPQVLTMFVGTYGAMLVALWLIFGTDINALITLGVCTVYFAMYFGMPVVMARMADKAAPRPAPGSLAHFLGGDVDTYTGPVSAWGAIAQLMTIPAGLTLGFIAIGIIIRLGT
jgi:hypothetical protein